MSTRAETLTTYFQHMAGHELLGAEGEVLLAREIEEREIEVWDRMLSFAPAVDYVLRVLEELREQGAMPEFRALRRAATIARKSRGKKAAREAFARQSRRVAELMRAEDRDRELVQLAMRALEGFSPRTRGFEVYRGRVEQAESRAARSRSRFVEANLRLVVNLAQKFRTYGLPFADLVQEGNLGLMKAVDRFDYRRGYRFSTYASWWIRHMIGRAVANTSRTVRVPVHVQDAQQRIARVNRRLSTKLGRVASDTEIADELGLEAERVERVRSRPQLAEVSLDAVIDDDGERTRLDVFVDPANDEKSLADEVADRVQAEHLVKLIDRLSRIEADVLRKRFAVAGEREWTLQEIANEYGLSRERIRQIQEAALDKLRTLATR